MPKSNRLSVIILDNYDSFTWNLVHLAEQFTENIVVRRNDAVTLNEIEAYDRILLSPGPGLPQEAGIMPELIARYAPSKNILGVCLGMQGIAQHFGARLTNLNTVLHGVTTVCHIHKSEGLLEGLPASFKAGHYHSWGIKPEQMPSVLSTMATNEQGWVMAFRHKKWPVFGVQFHPESILTEGGKQIIKNWLEIRR